jgi:hypothetical protein
MLDAHERGHRHRLDSLGNIRIAESPLKAVIGALFSRASDRRVVDCGHLRKHSRARTFTLRPREPPEPTAAVPRGFAMGERAPVEVKDRKLRGIARIEKAMPAIAH